MAITAKQKQFIEKVGKLAAADMKASGVLASLTIAQAILESGWGESGLTVKGNALFGIKAGANWKGKVYSGKQKNATTARPMKILRQHSGPMIAGKNPLKIIRPC